MKKETWKFILQTLAAIIRAILTSLGVSSCLSGLAVRGYGLEVSGNNRNNRRTRKNRNPH